MENDKWDQYIDRLDQYFIVKDIKPAVKVATLVTVIGREAYELMVNLCTPEKPSAKSYDDLVDIMKGHLQPNPSALAERFKFRLRVQKKGENIADYMAELKKLTKDCKFKASSLEENLRDQFVCGLIDENIRQRLFTEPDDIEYKRACQIAIAMEAAEANAALVEERTRKGDYLPTTSYSASSVHQIVTAKKGNNAKKSGRQLSGRSDIMRTTARNWLQGDGPRNTSGADSDKCQGGKGKFMRREYNKIVCSVCGGKHDINSCQFKQYVCRVCNRQGHLKKMCPNLRQETSLHNVLEKKVTYTDSDSENSEEVNNYSLHNKSLKKFVPYVVDVQVSGIVLSMEIDTGSAISCISYDCYKKKFLQCELLKTDLSLRYYTGEIIKPVGKITAWVKYKNNCKVVDLYVVEQGKTNLLGRQWINELKIEWPIRSCHNVQGTEEVFNLNNFSSRYCEVFSDGLGRFTGGTVGFRLREGARPVYLRARPLAYALREPVERALEQLVRDGIITPVETSDWATPIVPVMKKDGSIRVCGDFKLTLNKCLEVDRFPLPRVDDLLAKLHGGNKFTKLDLSQAYAQFELDESKKYTVINTHKGLFRYNRLIYGLSSSPGIFQRKLEQMFADLPRVGVFLDDVIITGVDDDSHLTTLNEVFRRLQTYGLKIKKEKCSFFADSVTYLGFVISKKGVHTCPDKLKAIEEVPVPKNVSELRSFLGLVMYYAKFVPNISTILSPLYTLLRKEVKYVWNDECEHAFNTIKNVLISSEILAHYSPDLPLVLTVDASSVGVGAVISHLTQQGERPVAYASRTLNSAERAYSQIEREALAIVFGVRKFHQFLYGRMFVLRTDHKPLVSIFGDKKGIPTMAASRLQRWAVLLAGYHFEIEYVRSQSNAADALSRLPVGCANKIQEECTYMNFIQNFMPIDRKTVQRAIEKDDVLRKVVYYIQTGWPTNNKDEALQPYVSRREELYLDMGCVVWGYRLVIPSVLRQSVLKEIHVGHMGIVKMKSIARSVVWWPGIDGDIEGMSRSCVTCAADSPAPPRAPLSPWPHITEPWSRLHVDFLGPYEGRTFFVMIDSTTKWLEVQQMQRTTAGAVIRVMREIFARFGLPKEVVSDNGPPFTSKEYHEFMKRNGVKVTFAPAYHPSSNGAAEGAVKLCKRAVKKAFREGADVDAALQSYLMAYRNVEQGTTGVSPAMFLQKRNLRSRLDLLKGERLVEDRVIDKQKKQTAAAGGTRRDFEEGDSVWVRNYAGGRKWVGGTIREKLGSRNYVVTRENGPPTKRHVDQVKNRWANAVAFPSGNEGNSAAQSSLGVPLAGVPCSVTRCGGTEPNDPITGSSLNVTPLNVPRPTLRPRAKLVPPRRYGFDID